MHHQPDLEALTIVRRLRERPSAVPAAAEDLTVDLLRLCAGVVTFAFAIALGLGT
jgi:hypothetical protein